MPASRAVDRRERSRIRALGPLACLPRRPRHRIDVRGSERRRRRHRARRRIPERSSLSSPCSTATPSISEVWQPCARRKPGAGLCSDPAIPNLVVGSQHSPRPDARVPDLSVGFAKTRNCRVIHDFDLYPPKARGRPRGPPHRARHLPCPHCVRRNRPRPVAPLRVPGCSSTPRDASRTRGREANGRSPVLRRRTHHLVDLADLPQA